MVEMLVKAGADVHARLHGPRDITPIAQVVIKGAGSADMTMLQTLLGEPGMHSHGFRLEVACQLSCSARHSLCGLLIPLDSCAVHAVWPYAAASKDCGSQLLTFVRRFSNTHSMLTASTQCHVHWQT